MTVLVTGSSGFIGRHLISQLLRNSVNVRVVLRHALTQDNLNKNVDYIYLPGSGLEVSDWADAVAGCKAVIHLAALAHIPQSINANSLALFRSANVEYAAACAEAASIAGVQRFIFMSTVGVHGDSSGDLPIKSDNNFNPHTAYAISKAEAEVRLANIIQNSEMNLTILRPPLVYGYGAPGNFNLLKRAISNRLPLPFGAILNNSRSFVGVDNLVSLIITCLSHPNAINNSFLVSDGEDVSTAEFLQRLGISVGIEANLFSFPISFLKFGSAVLGKRALCQSLCGSLKLDINKTCQYLDWSPPFSLDEGLYKSFKGD